MLCHHCVNKVKLVKGKYSHYASCPGCDKPAYLYIAHSLLFTYTFKHFIRGKLIDVISTESNSISGAVSKLSDMYAGVFLFVRKE